MEGIFVAEAAVSLGFEVVTLLNERGYTVRALAKDEDDAKKNGWNSRRYIYW